MESFGSVQSGKSSASLYVSVLEVTAATLIGPKHTWQGGTDKERHRQTDRNPLWQPSVKWQIVLLQFAVCCCYSAFLYPLLLLLLRRPHSIKTQDPS